VPDSRTYSTVGLLTPIWQRLLQVSKVDLDDNFFDLGGDSALAVQLFSEIAESCGRQLPPVMIYHVPTIASLATLLEEGLTPELSPLIPLKSGTHGAPVFIASGLGGGPAEFFQLVKYVTAPNTIFGLQPKGIEGFDTPCERIEDMANFYLKAVLRFQPQAPHILIGYSLGGLVALEMARELYASRRQVALLVMIDSYPDIKFLPPMQRLQLLMQRMKRRVKHFGQPSRMHIRLGGLPSPEAITTFAPAFDRVRNAAYRALRRYKPRPYPGPVKFIRAEQVTEFPPNPETIWATLVSKFESDTVPGDHLGMLTTHYEKVAKVLNRYLEAAANPEYVRRQT
jgi:acetoacetyl-CoA synthetase